tara:strand:+ start:590 stop:871 length:282 start_codon:yes stop_codon:yes gene_type:complete
MWTVIKAFLSDRANEASTKRALTILVGFAGYKLAPEHAVLISEIVVMVLVAFGILPDRKKSPAELAVDAKAAKEFADDKARAQLGLNDLNMPK